jgi:hypothetical protein
VSTAVVFAAVNDPEHPARMQLAHLRSGLAESFADVDTAGENAESPRLRQAVASLLTAGESTEELEARYRDLVEACVAAGVPRSSADPLELTT